MRSVKRLIFFLPLIPDTIRVTTDRHQSCIPHNSLDTITRISDYRHQLTRPKYFTPWKALPESGWQSPVSGPIFF